MVGLWVGWWMDNTRGEGSNQGAPKGLLLRTKAIAAGMMSWPIGDVFFFIYSHKAESDPSNILQKRGTLTKR